MSMGMSFFMKIFMENENSLLTLTVDDDRSWI